LQAEVHIKKLSEFRIPDSDRQRLSGLISKLSIEMQLQRHLL
jgi:hypothetical protein